jgi:hypothetical protein
LEGQRRSVSLFGARRVRGQLGNLAEHLRTHWQDEREAVITLHPANRDADQVALLIEHSAARDAGVAVSEAGDQPVGRPLSDVSSAQNDALRIVIAQAEDRLGEFIAVGGVDPQSCRARG